MPSNTANIQILRSYANTSPSTLRDGQLAYSFPSGKLFIGNSNNSIHLIGGEAIVKFAQQAFDAANAANTLLNVDWEYIKGVNSTQNTWIYANNQFWQGISDEANTWIHANNIFFQGVADNANNWIDANTRYFQGVANNTNNVIAITQSYNQGTNDSQNTWIHSNSTFFQSLQNTQNTWIQGSFNRANGAAEFAQVVFDSANTKLPLAGGTITGDLNVDGQANVYHRLAVGQGAYTILPNLIAQFTGTSDYYSQINNQNLSGNGTGDIVVTANNGTDFINYVDMGMAGSTYNNTGFNAFPCVNPNDGYFLLIGNPSQDFGGNVVYGTTGTYLSLIHI